MTETQQRDLPAGYAMIECTAGPYKRQRIIATDAEAARAIGEQWAFDPYSATPYVPPEMTTEQQEQIAEDAYLGAARLRGEPVPDPAAPAHKAPEKAQEKPAEKPAAKPSRDMHAAQDPRTDYQTRQK